MLRSQDKEHVQERLISAMVSDANRVDGNESMASPYWSVAVKHGSGLGLLESFQPPIKSKWMPKSNQKRLKMTEASFVNGRVSIADGFLRVDGQNIPIKNVAKISNIPSSPALKLVLTTLLVLFAGVSGLAAATMLINGQFGLIEFLIAVGIMVAVPVALIFGLWRLPAGKPKHSVSVDLATGERVQLTKFGRISSDEANRLVGALEKELAS